MTRRKKIYYPESQIERNLFTQGGEWMTLDDWKEYRGFYHRYETGEIFTEKEWDPLKCRELVKYKKRDEDYFRYLDLKHYTIIAGKKTQTIGGGNQFYRYVAPRAVKRIPTDIEKSEGTMNRFFIYKRNEPNRVFFEIDEGQTDDYERDHAGINQYLYGLVEVPWKIEGPERDVYTNGILTIPGVVDTNIRIVGRFSEKFPILKKLLNNPREHTKYDR